MCISVFSRAREDAFRRDILRFLLPCFLRDLDFTRVLLRLDLPRRCACLDLRLLLVLVTVRDRRCARLEALLLGRFDNFREVDVLDDL